MNNQTIINLLKTELQTIVEIEEVDIEDNFYDIGGNSLLAMQFMDTIENHFNVEVSIKDLFEQNIRSLATLIEEKLQ